jgi:hypothetical protein
MPSRLHAPTVGLRARCTARDGWIAGVGMLAAGLVAVSVHAAGYLSLTRDQTPTAQEARAPGDSDS